MKRVVVGLVAVMLSASCASESEPAPGSDSSTKYVVLDSLGGKVRLPYVEKDGKALVGGDVTVPLPKEGVDTSLHPTADWEFDLSTNDHLWPNARIPYILGSTGAAAQPIIDEAFAIYAARTPIRFVPRTNESVYIDVETAECCESTQFGYTPNSSVHQIQVARASDPTGHDNQLHIALHELGHVLGLIHEHQRSDRGPWLQLTPYFAADRPECKVDTYGTTVTSPYDTFSVMHYESTSCSTTAGQYGFLRYDGGVIARRPVLSAHDADSITRVYHDVATQGHIVRSATAVTNWGSRLDLFWKGPDGTVYHQVGNGQQGQAWLSIESLGSPNGQPFLYDPAAVTWGDGHVDVFVVGNDHQLWHRQWQNGWTGWLSLGGYCTSSPSAVSLHAGHEEVFVRGGEFSLWHNGRDNNGSFTGWSSLGGNLASGPAALAPNFRFQRPGQDRLFAYVFANNDALYQIAWTATTGWTSWGYLGEEGTHTSDPGAVALDSTNVTLFWRGVNHELVEKSWFDAWGAWSATAHLDGALDDAPRATVFGSLLGVVATGGGWSYPYVKTWAPATGWSSFNPVYQGWSLCGGMGSGQSLWSGSSVHSCDGRFLFTQQTDGNVVLYQGTSAIWWNGSYGSGNRTTMQADGNLVTYRNDGLAIWASNTPFYGGAHLEVQNDGNTVLYDTAHYPRWSTNTCCR